MALAFISPRNAVVEAVRSAFCDRCFPTGPDGAYDSFSLFGFNPGGFQGERAALRVSKVEEALFVKGYEAAENQWDIQPVWPVAVPRPESSELNHPVPCPIDRSSSALASHELLPRAKYGAE